MASGPASVTAAAGSWLVYEQKLLRSLPQGSRSMDRPCCWLSAQHKRPSRLAC